MGRHAKGATRSGFSAPRVILGTLIVAVVAVGSWLGSQAQPTSIATTPVSGSAVVVSSLACNGGSGSTVVDVLGSTGPAVRTGLDACGLEEGEQLAVLYPAGDPGRAWPAYQGIDEGLATGGLSPFGLGVAAVLGFGAVFAVWADGRRSRRARLWGRQQAAHEVFDNEGVADDDVPDAHSPDAHSPDAHSPHAMDEALTMPGQLTFSAADDRDGGRPGEPTVDRRPSTVDLVFPFTSSLAASLHDELFTHRSIST